MSRYAQVIVDLTSEKVDRAFTYRVPDGLDLVSGQRVLVPFGPRRIEGIVIGLADETGVASDKIRSVEKALESEPAVLPELMRLAEWMRENCHCTLASALRLMIPAQLRGARVKVKTEQVAEIAVLPERLREAEKQLSRAPKQAEVFRRVAAAGSLEAAVLRQEIPGADGALRALAGKGLIRLRRVESLRRPYGAIDGRRREDPVLTGEQQAAADELIGAMETGGGRFLLRGVTGSGKTEVYIRCVRHALAQGKGAIVLVPEIALTPQMVEWFRARFGEGAAVLHSRLSPGERYDEWRRIRRGEARVVVGARSAAFAPVENLGILIIDEEHESTYQSDSNPRYDVRDAARARCGAAGAVLLLGSATPSIGSYMRTMPGVRPENRFRLLELNRRINGRPLPQVDIVDMSRELQSGNHSVFSAKAQQALKSCLERGEQAILLMNRRGYATFVSCRACGYVERCSACDVSMTYHQWDHTLKCHYCGEERKAPDKCPSCGSPFIRYFGSGTQKVEEEAARLLPQARIVRMDMDTTRGKDAHEKILTAFRNGEYDILVGTQMIAKGLDFPNVTLVCVVAADMTLNLPDYRSPERTFQLLTQVAGRAGRAEKTGRVIVQTYMPDAYAIRMAARQDYRAFYQAESTYRRRGLYPPFTVLARLLVTGPTPEETKSAAQELELRLSAFLNESALRQSVVQMRALEAPIARLKGESRWQVFIKTYARGKTDLILEEMERMARGAGGDVRVELEVNPTNMF
ncbi:MAG: primosomal protein N' [Clostridia bacterium]|nr:primosomal protein N' [Clostridia bacterium]